MTTEQLVASTIEQAKRLKFNEASHRYWLDGRAIPATTTICKKLDAPQLDAWKVRVQVEGTARAAFANPPAEGETVEAWTERLKALAAQQYESDRLAREAADNGREVHALVEWRLRRMLGQDDPRPKVSEAAAFREAGWEKWAKDVRLKPLMIEARVFHEEHHYCGTIDLLAEVEGVVSLWDWKKAPAIYESHELQGIGYRMALESMGWPRMPGYVLLMPEGEDPRPGRLSDSQETREAFLSCLRLYRWTSSLAKAKRGEAA